MARCVLSLSLSRGTFPNGDQVQPVQLTAGPTFCGSFTAKFAPKRAIKPNLKFKTFVNFPERGKGEGLVGRSEILGIISGSCCPRAAALRWICWLLLLSVSANLEDNFGDIYVIYNKYNKILYRTSYLITRKVLKFSKLSLLIFSICCRKIRCWL